MTIADRYIARTVVAGALIALAAIVALDMVFSFVDEAGALGEGEYGAGMAMLYIALTTPQSAYEAFPFATLIGALMGLGGLAARHELTVLRASGVSVLGIGRAVLIAGLGLAAVAVALGEVVVPPAERYATELRGVAQAEELGGGLGGGLWARDGRRFVEVGRAHSPHHLEAVRLYELDDERRLAGVTTAAEARWDGEGWTLFGVERTRLAEDGVSVAREAQRRWQSALRPEVLEVVVVEPESLSLAELRTYVGYLEANELDSDRYRLAFWIKVATPASTLAMLLLTVPLVFGQVRSASAGQRVFVAVIVGVVFFLLNRMLNHAGVVYGVPPMLAALTPPLLVLAAAAWLASRVR